MDNSRFESLITRLENTASEHPRRYLASALAVAFLGFAILGIAMLFALIPALLLAAMALIVVATGGKALVVLLKLGKFILLLLIPAWVMVKSSVQLLFTRFSRPQGHAVTREEAPQLFARIAELRQRMKGPPIHHVLLTDELNASIYQHPRFGLFGWEENYLILGLPLLQTMSEEEALSVVAHEYGHLSGHHSRLGGFIYRFRSAWGRMQTVSEQWTDWGSRLIARLFRWYAPYFNAYTFVLARKDEYVADRIAAEVAGSRNAANALMRVSIAAQFENEVFWPSIHQMIADNPQPIGNRSNYWVKSLDERLDESSRLRYLEIAGKRQTDHLDTHPALRDRLKAIGAEADESAAQELVSPAQNAAEIWLGNTLNSVQAEFDQAWQKNASENWQERYRHLDECRQKLAAIQSQETLTVDDRWELIKLTNELKPDQDPLPALNEFLQQEPNHASALYLRGTVLLERNDEAGIPDMERVMEIDADAIMPCCEAAWRYYLERNPELAEEYRNRWIARSDYEDRVRDEYRTLPSDATLASHDLDEETEERIRKIVQAHGEYVKQAYLLRRILKSDNTLHDYVLAFETRYSMTGDKGAEVVSALVKEEFPVTLFIVHLGAKAYKPFRKKIEQLGIAAIVGS